MKEKLVGIVRRLLADVCVTAALFGAVVLVIQLLPFGSIAFTIGQKAVLVLAMAAFGLSLKQRSDAAILCGFFAIACAIAFK